MTDLLARVDLEFTSSPPETSEKIIHVLEAIHELNLGMTDLSDLAMFMSHYRSIEFEIKSYERDSADLPLSYDSLTQIAHDWSHVKTTIEGYTDPVVLNEVADEYISAFENTVRQVTGKSLDALLLTEMEPDTEKKIMGCVVGEPYSAMQYLKSWLSETEIGRLFHAETEDALGHIAISRSAA